jgi:heavy metal translocating P-type ATPase
LTSERGEAGRRLTETALALLALALGGVARLVSGDQLSQAILMTGLAVSGAPVVWRTVRDAARGHFATDIVATLAIVGALLVGHPFAGLIVVLMQTGGEALERYAAGRASAALRQLEADAPRVARRLGADGAVTDIRVDQIAVGDRLVIRPGDLVPCDCEVLSGRSHIDTVRITGEPIPRSAAPGSRLASGVQNIEGALTVRALAPAAESQYERIVALVRSAQASKAPLQRLADRYAVWFTPATLGVCAVTWLVSHDASRVLAVLTIATPCPLLLATPVAIIGGINQAARRHVIVRDGAALEALSAVSAVVVDKTGTVTTGVPEVEQVVPTKGGTDAELLRLAGSLEQFTSHVVGRAIARAAAGKSVPLSVPTEVREAPGEGMTGVVDGHQVAIGGRAFVERVLGAPLEALAGPATGRLIAWAAVDGHLAGHFVLDDRPREGMPAMLAELREMGVARAVMLSGDDPAHTRSVAAMIGIAEVEGGLLPADKAQYVAEMQRAGERVLMIGDGTNDAPVLAAADVGLALGGHGGGIAAEAADAVLLTDDMLSVPTAMRIARRSMRIARQSIRVGLGLSIAGMGLASVGWIGPAAGALIQEAIDIAVILNALRSAAPVRPRDSRA